jgi:hypothetical protein
LSFGQDASALAPIAKPFFLEILSTVGARLDDFDAWTATVKKNELLLEGKLSPVGLRALFSLVAPPAPVQVREDRVAKPTGDGKPPPPSGGATPPAATVDPKIAASQKYYATISGILDRLARSIGTGAKNASLADGAAWMQRDARRIARLPIKDVDPDLVRWGADVNARLAEAAGAFVSGTYKSKARTAGIYGTFDYDYNTYDGYNQNEMARVEGQRMQAAAEERASALEGASGAVRDLLASRDNVRAMLVQKYNVEF